MMMKVEIVNIQTLTHDVNRFKVEKPSGYTFVPGQATEVSIDKEGWREEKRPFTFTSLPEDDHLEFVIKSYRNHDGVTNQIDHLKRGDHLLIDESWGAIEYKGKGVFLAGGAGVTPFISILKSQKANGKLKGNQLIFANKTSKDVIMENWFRQELGSDFISILDQEKKEGHEYGRIDKEFLEKHISDFKQKFYVCGPEPMIESVKKDLEKLGAELEEIVFEK
ncbi:FAD-binding oxidoreductase [Algoriphagus sp. PAP.12]|uniref:FAD-binding oxidoreductase n=1 Tax=Algoriphagus sp. PAP.12 TaxID=2996678 RepID=UPI00227CED42|nr:FAD-binding oxidoreductase [Algoriphagus sp. PAP.12]